MTKEQLIPLSEARSVLPGLLAKAQDSLITLTRYGRRVGVLLPFARYEALLDRIEDLEDQVAILQHRTDPEPTMRIDKVRAELGL
jgi:prevent-host-death family protein